MTKSILVVGIILALSACSSVNEKGEQDLKKPVNCATAEGDLRALRSEKAHTSDQIKAGVSAIVPVGLVINASKGKEGETMNVASGKYNKMIDKKIAEIKSECGL